MDPIRIRIRQLVWGAALILVTVALTAIPLGALWAQTPTPAPSAEGADQVGEESSMPLAPAEQAEQILDARVEEILSSMDAADRVGQLFVVNFQGNDTGFDSDIALLIHAYRIGGVVLSPAYQNFSNDKNSNTPGRVASLANQLQALAYGYLLSEAIALPSQRALYPPHEWVAALPPLEDGAVEAGRSPLNVPLFIAVEQAGDDLSATYLRRGFTQLPSQMALGATWNPALAEEMGRVIGRELAAVGVNMLLGPGLDVLEPIRTDSVGRIGIHSFGGSTYWVSKMGKAYITGVHNGAAGHLAVMARHFPGQGGVDRLPNEQVATIQSSTDELRRVAIPPFTAVTQDAPNRVDGLMSSHMRYVGLLGSSPDLNTPLSLAPELALVLEREGFAEWRQQGGVVMSNALGVPAVRRHYDPTLQEFPYHRAALDAFAAGNDLIYLGEFGAYQEWEEQRVGLESAIGSFQERYRRDPDFAAQVDDSVRRILKAKLRLYAPEQVDEPLLPPSVPATPADSVVTDREPPVHLADVMVTKEDLHILAEGDESRLAANAAVREVARESITVLYPDSAVEPLPSAPTINEPILLFTDSRLNKECEVCRAEVTVGPDELADIIERLYGLEATGQVTSEQVVSLTFAELTEYLDAAQVADGPEPAEPLPNAESPDVAPIPDEATGLVSGDGSAQVVADDQDRHARTAQLIQKAEWIIFAMLDVDPQTANSDAVKRFLSQHSADIQRKQVVVLALHAPYYLDATEIGQLSLYLGVYSRSQPFLENAVRAIFRSFTPTGAPPVNVPGTRFSSLAERLEPDAQQVIPLQVLGTDGHNLAASGPGEPPLQVDADDSIRLHVGPILDYNGHPVPDGTPVQFQVDYEGEELVLSVEPAVTRDGLALRDVKMERGGSVRIAATSGEASTGEFIHLAVSTAGGAQLGAAESSTPMDVAPAAESTEIVTAVAAVNVPVPAIQPDSMSTLPGQAQAASRRVTPSTLLVALIVMTFTLMFLLIVQVRTLPRHALVYNLLWAVIMGLGVYVAYGVGLLPGSDWLYRRMDIWAAGVVVLVGMTAPLLWLQLRMD